MRIPTVFIDETGTTHDRTNMIFGIGALTVQDPISLSQQIRDIRNKHQYYEDIKFNKVSEDNSQILRDLIKLFLENENIHFTYTLHDKRKAPSIESSWELYLRVLIETINSVSYKQGASIVLDYISMPKDIFLSGLLRAEIELPVYSAITVSSKGVELIQLCDLLLGLVAYSMKLELKLVDGDEYKARLTNDYHGLITKKG